MVGTDPHPLVVLRGGISVPAAAYSLLLDFEARGISVERDGAYLLIGPRERLTADDDRAIRVLKPYLLTLVTYTEAGAASTDGLHFRDTRPEPAHA